MNKGLKRPGVDTKRISKTAGGRWPSLLAGRIAYDASVWALELDVALLNIYIHSLEFFNFLDINKNKVSSDADLVFSHSLRATKPSAFHTIS